MSDGTNKQADLLQRMMQALDEASSKLAEIKYKAAEPIAVIGMACRFPGAESPEEFWQLLAQGRDQVREIPPERWDVDQYYDPLPGKPGKSYVRHAAFLDQIDQFDPQFFGISPREATYLDPQQRLLLEVSWEALERAGQAPSALKNSKTGVFIGVSPSEYTALLDEVTRSETYVSTGNVAIFASGRLSYVLGLQGPNLVIDTACSASLIGVHLACESLRNGSSDLALAGGAHLLLSPHEHVSRSQMLALAPDGRCKTFDAAANGFGRGEGCGMVVLKRLSAALADRDPILAIIRGSATNHDGPGSGLTVPNASAQAALIRQALANGNVKTDEIGYIEAHGTGTALGDPLEMRALATVFAAETAPLWVSSAKTNIGHLEEASGVAGLIKVILAMQHAEIPPHLHLRHPTAHIDWDQIALRVPTVSTAWPRQAENRKKLAGVSAFGMGGSNAHLVVAEAPVVEKASQSREHPCHLLTLSAKSAEALRAYAQRYQHFFASHPTLDWGDLCYTSQIGRSHFAHRLSLVADSAATAQTQLAAYLAGAEAIGLQQGVVESAQAPHKVAFLFTGQGSQSVQMGRGLYETQPTFRAILDRCDQLLQPLLDRPLLDRPLLAVLYPDKESAADSQSQINDTTYTQPALFALEVALATLWQSWGIQPDLLIGHSVGELAAACVAGVFSLEDGLKLIAARARLMGVLPQEGEMLAVMAEEAYVQAAIAPYLDDVSIAASNGPQHMVISGKRERVQRIAAQLTGEGIKSRLLNVSHAFHSPLMEPMMAEFRRLAATITYHKPSLRLVSNVTGKLAGDEITTPDYWVRHVRSTVRFAAGLQTLHEQGVNIFLEIGPKPVLIGMIGEGERGRQEDRKTGRQGDKVNGNHPLALPSLRAGKSDWQQMLESVGALYGQGVKIDWQGLGRDYQPHKVLLPTYPFQRQRYWVERAKQVQQIPSLRPLIDKKMRVARQKQTIFEKTFSLDTLPFLADHQVYGEVVVPGACYLSLALSAAELLFDGAPCQVEDVIFPQALSLPDGEMRTVQLIADPQLQNGAEDGFTFQISSFGALEDADEALLHASGRIVRARTNTPARALAELQARCVTEVLPATLYDRLAADQVVLGDSFRWLAGLWQGAEGEALAQLQMPETVASVHGYRLFPSLLDGCFQVVGAAMLGATPNHTEAATQLPFALDSLTLYNPTDHQSLWCHATQQDEKRWEIALLTETGQMVAQMRGFQLRAVSPSAMQGERLRTDWLYTLNWQDQPLTAPTHPSRQPAGWLLFAAEQGVGRTLATQYAETGTPTILVTPAVSFQSPTPAPAGLFSHATVDPTDPVMFQQLLNEVARHYPTLGIGYLWGLDEAIHGTTVTQQSVDLCAGLLHLVQAAINTEINSQLWIVTRDADQVTGTAPLATAAGALWGLGRTIALEHPHLSCTCIDLQADTVEQQVMTLHQELKLHEADKQTEQQIRYQGDRRQVARLVNWHPGQTKPQAAKRSLSSTASYLITGGLGALGLETAAQLVADGARSLVLSGRNTAASAETQARIRQWQDDGVAVHLVQADIGQRSEVERLLATCQALAPLRGIVHAAGVLDDGLIQAQSLSRFGRVMAAKVQGTWWLHSLTLATPLDFFVCYSSAAGLFGSPGQSNYAAANAFMDRLMQQRQQHGLPGLSINWGSWAEVGMAAKLTAQQRAQQAQLIQPMSLDQARKILGYLLAQDVAQIGVFDLNRQALAQQEPFLSTFFAALRTEQTEKGLPPPATLKLTEQLRSLSHEEQYEQLSQMLCRELARILGMATTQQISLQQPLFELGLDSLMALELKNRLERKLETKLHATLIFDYPTIARLTTYLLDSLGGTAPQPESRNEIISSLATGAISPEIDQLSGAELLDFISQVTHLSP